MKSSLNIEVVVEWLQLHPRCGMVLPDGWSGFATFNRFEVTSAQLLERGVLIVFEQRHVLIITQPHTILLQRENTEARMGITTPVEEMRLQRCKVVVWVESGEKVSTWKDGDVRFVHYAAEIV